MVPADRRHARLQLRVERMYGDHPRAVLLQVPAGLGSAPLLGGESSGEGLNNESIALGSRSFRLTRIHGEREFSNVKARVLSLFALQGERFMIDFLAYFDATSRERMPGIFAKYVEVREIRVEEYVYPNVTRFVCEISRSLFPCALMIGQ